MRKVVGFGGSAVAALIAGSLAANSASLSNMPASCAEASQLLNCLNQLVAAINAGITPASMGNLNSFRNVLDNGALLIQQRGTSARTCAANAGITTAAYSADRWACQVNVGSGAGQLTAGVTTAPLVVGFPSYSTLARNSGALTQPQCVWQEISTYKSIPLQGQQVVLSSYMKALAGLNADNGSVANLVIITGTGTDEGLAASPTASPAITPAWTGIATQINTAVTLTTAWQRYSTTVQIPTTAKEIGVGLCFTPTATGAGATDGFAFVGVQLEQGSAASAFEHRSQSSELMEAQRYFIRYNEINSAGAIQFGGGTALGTSTTCSIVITFPTTMRIAPTYTNALSATTFTVTSASQAATALGTPFSATLGANGVNNASINFTTTGMTAKDGCEITSTAAGSGVLDFVADF